MKHFINDSHFAICKKGNISSNIFETLVPQELRVLDETFPWYCMHVDAFNMSRSSNNVIRVNTCTVECRPQLSFLHKTVSKSLKKLS